MLNILALTLEGEAAKEPDGINTATRTLFWTAFAFFADFGLFVWALAANYYGGQVWTGAVAIVSFILLLVLFFLLGEQWNGFKDQ